MAWPDKNEPPVECIDFDSSYFPAIKQAVDAELVEWGETKIYVGYGTGEFKWANCTWKIEEHYERVTTLQLVDGTPNREEMILSVLRGNGKTGL